MLPFVSGAILQRLRLACFGNAIEQDRRVFINLSATHPVEEYLVQFTVSSMKD